MQATRRCVPRSGVLVGLARWEAARAGRPAPLLTLRLWRLEEYHTLTEAAWPEDLDTSVNLRVVH